MDALSAVLPSIGVGLLFWYAIRGMLHADRREREEAARFEREHRSSTPPTPQAAPDPGPDPGPAPDPAPDLATEAGRGPRPGPAPSAPHHE